MFMRQKKYSANLPRRRKHHDPRHDESSLAVHAVRSRRRVRNVGAAPQRRSHKVLVVVCRVLQISDSIFDAERCGRLSELAISSDRLFALNPRAVRPTLLYGGGGTTGPAGGAAAECGH